MEQSPSELIADKGAQAIAEALKVDIGTVRVWKHRDRIPRTVWPELVGAFPDLTVEELLAMEARGAAA